MGLSKSRIRMHVHAPSILFKYSGVHTGAGDHNQYRVCVMIYTLQLVALNTQILDTIKRFSKYVILLHTALDRFLKNVFMV